MQHDEAAGLQNDKIQPGRKSTRAPHAGANARLQLHLENSKSKKGHNFDKKIEGLPPLLIWVPLLIADNYSEFQVNIFSNNRDIRNVKVFARRPGYDNISTFSSETAGLKMAAVAKDS